MGGTSNGGMTVGPDEGEHGAAAQPADSAKARIGCRAPDLLHPELTASATRNEAAELAGATHDAYVSTNRTCEIGLQQETGAAYESILVPLERLHEDLGDAGVTGP